MYIYKVFIIKEKYCLCEFIILSEYSLEVFGVDFGGVQQLVFKKIGLSVFEVVWFGVDLQFIFELF